jgi:E3 ubiquitin-protein ligase SIAH1
MDHHSTSAMPTNATSVSGGVARLFICPMCCDYFLPPILQCYEGHLICSNCLPKATRCAICREPLRKIRNLAMEQFASIVMFPCKYSTSGCAVSLLHTERREHEESCEFWPYSSLCQGACRKWQGSSEEVVPHLTMSHESITNLKGEDVIFTARGIKRRGARSWVMMQSCFGHHFRSLLEKRVKCNGYQHFCATVQLFGTRKQAEKFEYRLEIKGQKKTFVMGSNNKIHP